jgi:D,D-heptose 1,7-bisphosphate phosphatase
MHNDSKEVPTAQTMLEPTKYQSHTSPTGAIFLNKDGAVLIDIPPNVDPLRMRFAAGAFAGLDRLGLLGLPLIVISNQPGVALGKFSVDKLAPMRSQLEKMFVLAGTVLGGFYYCPHHPKGVHPLYSTLCNCRKPSPGLLRLAAQRQGIDLTQSWLIGNVADDIEAGRRAGCRTILLDKGIKVEGTENEWRQPHRIEADLDGASRWICAQSAMTGRGAMA